VEELVLDGFGGGGAWLAAGGGCDDGEQLKLGERSTGDVEALGVGAGVWRGKKEAVVVGEGIEEGAVRRGQTLHEIACTERETQPKALRARTGEEGAAGEALRVDGIGEVEIADVANNLDVVE
jgi:hypothetical protein